MFGVQGAVTDLLCVGFGAHIVVGRVLAICDPDSAPIKRMIQGAKKRNLVIDVTYGRATRTVIVLDTGHIVLVALKPRTMAKRLGEQERDYLNDKQESCYIDRLNRGLTW